MSWCVKSIDDITEVVTKGTTPSTYGMPFTDEGINFVKAEALNGDVTLDRSGFTFIDDETHEKLKRSKLQQHDVLVTIAGANVGKCGYVRPSDVPANTNQAVGIARVKKEEANPRYIYYHFKNPSTFAMCQGIGGGQAAQPNINLTMLKGFKVNVPDLESQNRIVGVIGAYDDLIENNKRRIELLEESARQLYKEWFVRFRFPGHEHVKIIDGVPEGWTAGCVGDTAKVFSGYAFKSKDWLEEGNPVIKIKNITSTNTVDVSGCQCVDDNVAEKAAKFKLSAGDMLIAMTGATVGKVGLMPTSERSFYLNQRVGKFETKIGRDVTPLLLSFFNSEKAQSSILNLAGGAAQPNISAKQIESIELPIPPETLLNTFLDETENLFTLRLNLVDQIFRLTQARDLLLPKLMNGEIAV
ncbi:MAG: restriction endonuclease subunit S [Pseudomonadota bacterium]|nr:restriction endonuclease subunit S [Pseudomonadota bacterium]